LRLGLSEPAERLGADEEDIRQQDAQDAMPELKIRS
jgi:hypothetical protein